MKIYLLILLTTFFLISCNHSHYSECRTSSDLFLKEYSSTNFEFLYGLSIGTRGLNDNGDKLIRPIEFTNKAKRSFRIPSIENTNYIAESEISLDSLAIEMGIEPSEMNRNLKSIYSRISIMFNTSNLDRIHSQKYLGDFVEFKFSSGCSLFYKEEGAYLNKDVNLRFNKSRKINENWYLLNTEK